MAIVMYDIIHVKSVNVSRSASSFVPILNFSVRIVTSVAETCAC